MTRLHRFAWVVLLFNVAVILWGAFVRATGSGAGCGAHWPLCNGEVVPRAPALATMIEFTHRATSGVALLLVVLLALWVFHERAKGHPARSAAAASVVFILDRGRRGSGAGALPPRRRERVGGARALHGRPPREHVPPAREPGADRALVRRRGAPVRRDALARDGWLFGLGAVVLLGVGKSGAVAALGDTLYPAQSILGGLAQDLSPTAHFLVRLRIAHPVLALAGALVAAFVAGRVLQSADDAPTRRAAWLVPAVGPRSRSAPALVERRAPRAGLDAGRPPAAGRRAVDRVRAPGRARPRPAAPAARGRRGSPGDRLALRRREPVDRRAHDAGASRERLLLVGRQRRAGASRGRRRRRPPAAATP